MRIVTVVLGWLFITSSPLSAEDRLPSRTLNELLSRSAAAVIGSPRKTDPESTSAGMVNVHFTVETLIKNGRIVGPDEVVAAKCRLRDLSDERFLLLCSKESNGTLRWKVKQAFSHEAVQHLVALSKVNLGDVKRLEFFFDYLENADPVIAGNADLEFLLTSDEAFALFARQRDPAEIRERLRNEHIPSHRSRLYLAMLARCGDASDGDWIRREFVESNLRSADLSAALSAYVALSGEEGLEFLDRRYLAAENVDFTATYSAIVALRYAMDHPQIGITTDRLLQSFRRALDQPLLFDIVVNDLGRLQDWPSIDRIVELSRTLEDPMYRMATINYLRRCPGDKAKQHLNEMAKRYPKAYQRAVNFYPESLWIKRKPSAIRWTGRPGNC